MQEKIEDLLRNKLNIGFYLDELSESDGHKIFISVDDLIYLNSEQLDKLINLLNEK